MLTHERVNAVPIAAGAPAGKRIAATEPVRRQTLLDVWLAFFLAQVLSHEQAGNPGDFGGMGAHSIKLNQC